MTLVFLLLSGVLAGVLIAVEIAVVPMLGALPGDRFVQVHRLLDPHFDPIMPRASKVALAAGVALVLVGSDGIVSRVAFALAVSCIVGVALVSELRNVPINRRIETWDGSKWSMTSDFMEADFQIIKPMVKAAADKYIADKKLTRRTTEDCQT